MNVTKLEMDPYIARVHWRNYLKDRHYAKPIDAEIARVYKQLAMGKTVIRALESIKQAGLNAQGLPKLAIGGAKWNACSCRMDVDGGVIFEAQPWIPSGWKSLRIDLPNDTFVRRPQGSVRARALLPIIPIHLRPKRALAKYHILFEAEWGPVVPGDPFLLRRLGGDAWLVVAAWDLTEVEKAVLSTRVQ